MKKHKNTMSNHELSEQEIIRRKSLDELRNLGIDPYPAAEYPVNATAALNIENPQTVTLK